MIDIILLGLLIILSMLLVRNKYQFNKLKNRLVELERAASVEPAKDFTQGLTNSDGELTAPVSSDLLTGLPSRQAFDDRLLQTLNQSKRFEQLFGIIILDINEFGTINDAEGYEVGDKLLKEVATRQQRVIRQIDTMTRFAGNTFVFLLPQLAMPETAAYVVQRLLDSIVQPFSINKKNILITASAGVVIYPLDGEDVNTLLKHATDALHEAKIFGKSRYQFYRQETHALSQFEIDLSTFLSKPDALLKFIIQYRPYVDINSEKIIFVEALPCFDLPEHGLVKFKDFAKTAENCGKMLEISDWLLRNSIERFKLWQSQGLNLESLIINVTIRQIRNPQFIYRVTKICEDLKMDTNKIIFEISEKNSLNNSNALEKSFSMLNQVNMQIGLSIISLGHFALQKITKLPINYLKIDGKAMQAKNENKEYETVMHMIIALAKDMNLKIIADDVDSVAQKDLLKEFGCEIMQGQLFKEPLPG